MKDFNQLTTSALPHLESICRDILPGGKTIGNRYECSGLDGGKGGSLSVYLNDGGWVDFASGEKGGLVKLISLTKRLTMQEAAEWLESKIGAAPATAGPLESEPTL